MKELNRSELLMVKGGDEGPVAIIIAGVHTVEGIETE